MSQAVLSFSQLHTLTETNKNNTLSETYVVVNH